MEKGTASGTITTTQQQYSLAKKDDDDVPTELMHLIQSNLSLKEAARTCVLSKSWLHAWSTIPYLWFPGHAGSSATEEETKNNNLVFRTVQRYHRDAVPFQGLDFEFHVRDPVYTEFWFRLVLSSSQTRSCLQELYLEISNLTDSVFTFSDDILFSGHKLQTITLKAAGRRYGNINPGINPVIKCVSLRVLVLDAVIISEDVFHNLLSTCSLLEVVSLDFCKGLKTIKVKNLSCLRQLQITFPANEGGLLEVDNVPSLVFFYCRWIGAHRNNLFPFKTTGTTASSLGRSVKCLHLNRMIIDDAFFDMIKSKFLFLESLILVDGSWASERLVITSLSLKRLTLDSERGQRLTDLQVYAPCLLSFDFYGTTLPATVVFPTTAPREIKLSLEPRITADASFFLKLREVLNLSSKFDIHIKLRPSSDESLLFPFNAEDLRKRVAVTNVQLSLEILDDRCREHTRVFDALFSICHPIHVKVLNYNLKGLKYYWKRFSKLTVVRGMMENNTTDLKEVLMENPLSGRWEALTSSWETEFRLIA